jgi:hypothetical protein
MGVLRDVALCTGKAVPEKIDIKEGEEPVSLGVGEPVKGAHHLRGAGHLVVLLSSGKFYFRQNIPKS